MQEKIPAKLKNIYNNEVVICDDVDNYRMEDGIPFVRVYKEENPKRTFLVNLKAYNIIKNYT
jgi:hypothetical protein